MPARPVRRLAVAFVCSALLLTEGCGDSSEPGGDAALIEATDALFPDDATGDQALTLAGDLLDAAGAGDDAGAQSTAFDLIELTLIEYRAGRLQGVAAQLPATLDGYLTTVMVEAGLPEPPLDPASFSDEGIVAVVRPAGGTFVAGTLRAGLDVPAGALGSPVLLVATRLPDASAHAPGDGPLPTDLPQYPLFYDFSLTPEAELSADAIIGLCQVTEPGSPYYAPDPVFQRLRLAHPDPDDRTVIELLDRVDAPFLECDGVTADAFRRSLLARRAGIGGRVRKFSPFGAVEPSTTLGEGLITPLPYRSFSDSPFNGVALGYFHLENWEDGLVNTPGVTTSSTTLGSSFGAGFIDSVDGDDGAVNGTCSKPDGICDSGWSSGAFTFTFDAAALGALPTHVGVVWTDGSGNIDVTFEAYDANDVLIAGATTSGIGDGGNSGTVEEDRFFGIVAPVGVRRIVVINSGGGLEVDHLQYGR